MLVRKLSYLVALAQEKHFGRAAQHLLTKWAHIF